MACLDSGLRPPNHGESESILSNTVLPPPTELLGLVEAIDDSLGVYLAARTNWGQSTEWEALRYAVTMSNHALRNAEATLVLARNDMTLLSSAWATARVATESTLKMLWLLEDTMLSEVVGGSLFSSRTTYGSEKPAGSLAWMRVPAVVRRASSNHGLAGPDGPSSWLASVPKSSKGSRRAPRSLGSLVTTFWPDSTAQSWK